MEDSFNPENETVIFELDKKILQINQGITNHAEVKLIIKAIDEIKYYRKRLNIDKCWVFDENNIDSLDTSYENDFGLVEVETKTNGFPDKISYLELDIDIMRNSITKYLLILKGFASIIEDETLILNIEQMIEDEKNNGNFLRKTEK